MRMKLIFETKNNKLTQVKVLREYDNFDFFYADRTKDRIEVMQRDFGSYLRLSKSDFANAILKILLKKEILNIKGVSSEFFTYVKEHFNIKLTQKDIKERINLHFNGLKEIERAMESGKNYMQRTPISRKSSYQVG